MAELKEISTTEPKKIKLKTKKSQNSRKRKNVSDKMAGKKVFTIPLIYEKFFKLLDLGDLKTCRLVSRQWLNVASRYLIEKDSFKIHMSEIECSHKSAEFIHCSNIDDSEFKSSNLNVQRKLDQLNLCLNNSKIFPCTHFKFVLRQLMSSDLNEFFTIFGSRIKTLELATHRNLFERKEESLLFSQALKTLINIERLDLSLLSCHPFEMPIVSFPKLTYLKLTNSYLSIPNLILRGILKGASNIEIVDNFDLCYTDLLIEAGQIDKVKSLDISKGIGDKGYNLDDNLKFADCQPQLKKVKFVLQYESQILLNDENVVMAHFIKMLTSSQRSLIELELSEFHYKSLEIQFQFPELFRLEKLDLVSIMNINDEQNNSKLKMFPLGINLNKTFPNLRILSFTNLNMNDFFTQPSPFPWWEGDDRKKFCGNLPSVQKLEINGDLNEHNLKSLMGLCPNFSRLKLKNYATFHSAHLMPLIFDNWRHLKELEIFAQSTYHSWDSIFTGFSIEFCEKINTKKIVVRKPTKFRTSPWIGLVTGLNKLQINFQDLHPTCHRHSRRTEQCYENYHGRRIPIHLTCLSGLYAFQLMPNLKVTVGYQAMNIFSKEIKRSLESISPFVDNFVDCGNP